MDCHRKSVIPVLTEVINSERSILSVFEDSESKTLIIDYDHGNYYYRFSVLKILTRKNYLLKIYI